MLEVTRLYTREDIHQAEKAMEESARRGGELVILPFSPGLNGYLGSHGIWETECESPQMGVGVVLFQSKNIGSPWRILLIKEDKPVTYTMRL